MPRNYTQVFAICKKIGVDYQDLVDGFTGGRTASLRELTDAEYAGFLTVLKELNGPVPADWSPLPGNRMRRKIIAIARDMGWDRKGQADMMQRIDEFCITRTKYKIPLMELTEEQLGKVLTIFEREVKRSFLAGYNK